MGITITKVKTQKWVKDHHSKGIFPSGEKTEYFLEYNNEEVPVPGILAQNEFTSQSTRDWFQGKTEMTVLMAEELGSHLQDNLLNTIVNDLFAYLKVNKDYESKLNVLPPIKRQTQYYKPAYKRIAEMQGNTVSRAILEWQVLKASDKAFTDKHKTR